ncbi:WYL domain-containing protein [Erwinia aphidicola]|uniref:WYL domain-containing protein n=1 Tax=Erwinia aphidicola TaxID=68334 RepID=UPI0030D41535
MSHSDAHIKFIPLGWEQKQRFRLLEIVLYWEGRLNTHYLCNAFNIGRQQASRDINRYIAEISPEGLIYDRQAKTYKPTSHFIPCFSRGSVDEYLMLLHGNQWQEGHQPAAHDLPVIDLRQGHIATVDVPARHIEPVIVRSLVEAARHQLRVDVDYISLGSGEQVGRNIVPHTLVFDGIRWHVRAWCEKEKAWLDFVMSRFRGIPDLLNASEQGISADVEWNSWLTAVVVPNPCLSAAQQAIIAEDYAMTAGCMRLTQRIPLMHYVLERLKINYLGGHEKQPMHYPLVLANREELIAQGCSFKLSEGEQ